jgi:multiple sugar transport system ATP-binding protein
VHAGDETVRLHDAAVSIPRCHATAERVLLGIRPEHVVIDEHGPLRGKVITDEYLGSHQVLIIETAVGMLRARTSKDARLEAGSPVGLSFRCDRTLLYDAASGRLLPGAAHG